MRISHSRALGQISPLTLLFLVCLWPARAGADWVTMLGGERLPCLIESENEQEIRIRSRSGIITFQRSRVHAVRRDTKANNAVLQAEFSYQEDTLLETLGRYRSAMGLGASGSSLCDSLGRLIDKLSADEDGMSSESREVLIELLSSLSGPPSDRASEEFLFYGAQTLARHGSMDDAMRLFAKIPPVYFRKHPTRRGTLSNLVVTDIKRLLDEGKLEAAGQRLDALYVLDAERGKPCEAIVYLSQAGMLRREEKFSEAMEIYRQRILPEYPTIAKDRTQRALEEIQIAARDSGNFAQAIALIEGPGAEILGAEEIQQTLGDTHHDWAMWKLDRADFEGAREGLRQYYARNPEEGTMLLKMIDYREWRAQIDDADPEQHYMLGKFCIESELYDFAAAEFQRARDDPAWSEIAQAQIQFLETNRYEEMLGQALELNRQNRFSEALEKADFVRQRVQDEELVQKANHVYDLVRKTLAYNKGLAPKEAEVLWQRYERCEAFDNRESCLAILDEIIREYPETEAAEKAIREKRLLASRGLATFERQPERSRDRPVAPNQTRPRSKTPGGDGVSFAEQLRQETLRIQDALTTEEPR